MCKKILIFACLFLLASPAFAFQQSAANSELADCSSCHNLTIAEATEIFAEFQGEVLSVNQAEIPGLWQVGMKFQGEGQNVPLYLENSKSYLVSGSIIRIKDRKNLTEESYQKLNSVDISRIPTEDALLLGNPEAANKIIVFTDPHCPYCKKLHVVMKEAVEQRSDLLFQIKLMSIKKSSRKVAETIVCNKSLEQLEAAFEKKDLPVQECNSDVLDQTRTIARSLGIRSTPTLVFPNGRVVPGYKKLEALMQIIDQNSVVKTAQE